MSENENTEKKSGVEKKKEKKNNKDNTTPSGTENTEQKSSENSEKNTTGEIEKGVDNIIKEGEIKEDKKEENTPDMPTINKGKEKTSWKSFRMNRKDTGEKYEDKKRLCNERSIKTSD